MTERETTMGPAGSWRPFYAFDPGKALVLLVRGMIVVDLIAVVLACHVRLVNDSVEDSQPDVSTCSSPPFHQEPDRCVPPLVEPSP